MLLIALVQRGAADWAREEIATAITLPLSGLPLAFLIYQLARRVPWPRPFRLRFLAMHVVAAVILVAAWALASRTMLSLTVGGPVIADRSSHVWEVYVVIGGVMYTIIAGISYAVESTARAARAESVTARTQLAALQAQLHPHFLFNALHTVAQLIPVDPARAQEAVELVADLLRTTLEEQRDEVSLRDEWRFVSRYLALERIGFGDRLVVRDEIPDALLDASVPAFGLQTLVENAVRHGATPRVTPTELVISAMDDGSQLTLSVRNAWDPDTIATTLASGAGTGLVRLRERLSLLHGSAARLHTGLTTDGLFEAVLVVPRRGERVA